MAALQFGSRTCLSLRCVVVQEVVPSRLSDVGREELFGLTSADAEAVTQQFRVDYRWRTTLTVLFLRAVGPPLYVALIAPSAGGLHLAIRGASDLARCTLLLHVSVPDAWLHWRELHNMSELDPFSGPQFDQIQTMIRAVTVGMGVALVPRCLVQDEIAAGTVAEPLADGGYRSDLGYWFCYPEARARLAPLARFRDWLLPQVEAEAPTSLVTAAS